MLTRFESGRLPPEASDQDGDGHHPPEVRRGFDRDASNGSLTSKSTPRSAMTAPVPGAAIGSSTSAISWRLPEPSFRTSSTTDEISIQRTPGLRERLRRGRNPFVSIFILAADRIAGAVPHARPAAYARAGGNTSSSLGHDPPNRPSGWTSRSLPPPPPATRGWRRHGSARPKPGDGTTACRAFPCLSSCAIVAPSQRLDHACHDDCGCTTTASGRTPTSNNSCDFDDLKTLVISVETVGQ